MKSSKQILLELFNKYAGYNDLRFGDMNRNMTASEFEHLSNYISNNYLIIPLEEIKERPNDQSLGEFVRECCSNEIIT